MTAFNNPSFRSDTLQEKAKPDLFNPDEFGIEVPEKLSVPAPVEDTTSMPPEQVAGSMDLPRFNLDEFLAEPEPPAQPIVEQAFSPQEMAARQAMRQMAGTVDQFGDPSQMQGLDPNYELKLQQMQAVEQMQAQMIEKAPVNDVARVLSLPLGDMSATDLRMLDEMHSELQVEDPAAPQMDPAFVQLVQERHAEARKENKWEFGSGFLGTIAGAPAAILGGAISMVEGAKRIVPKALEAIWDVGAAEVYEAGEDIGVPGAREYKEATQQKLVSDFTGEEVEGREKGSVEKVFDLVEEYQDFTAGQRDNQFLRDFALALAEVSAKMHDLPEFRASLETIKELDAHEMTLDTILRVWGQGMASLAIIMVGGVVAGPAGVAAAGASMEASNAALSQYHNVYQKLIDEGLDKKQAHKQASDAAFVTGAYYGAASGVLEYVGARQVAAIAGLGKIALGTKAVSPTVTKSLAKRLGNLFQAAAAEGGTEASQVLAEKFISIAQDPTVDFGQKPGALQEWWNEQGWTQGELAMSAMAGFLSGGAAVTPTLAAGQIGEMAGRRRLRTLMEEATRFGIEIPEPTAAPTYPAAPPPPPPGDPIELLRPRTMRERERQAQAMEALWPELKVSPDATPETVPIDYPTDPDTGLPLNPVTTDTPLKINPVTGQIEIDRSAIAEPSPDAVEVPVAPVAPIPAPEAPAAPVPVEAPVAEPVTAPAPEAPVDTDLRPPLGDFVKDPDTGKFVYVPSSDIAEPSPAPEAPVAPMPVEAPVEEPPAPTYTYDSVTQDDTALDEFVGGNLGVIEEVLEGEDPSSRVGFYPIKKLFEGEKPGRKKGPLSNKPKKQAFLARVKESVQRVKQRQERAAQDVVPEAKKASEARQTAAAKMPTKTAGKKILEELKAGGRTDFPIDPGERLKQERESMEVSREDTDIPGAGGLGDFGLYLLQDTFDEATKGLSPAKRRNIAKHFSITEDIPALVGEEDTDLLDWYIAPEEARQKFLAEEAFALSSVGQGITFEELRTAAMAFAGPAKEVVPQTALDPMELQVGDSFTFTNGVGNLRVDNVTDDGLEVTVTLPGAYEGITTARDRRGVIGFDETVVVDETYFASEEEPAFDITEMAGPGRKDRDEYDHVPDFFKRMPGDIKDTLDETDATNFNEEMTELEELLEVGEDTEAEYDDDIPFSTTPGDPKYTLAQRTKIVKSLFKAMQRLSKTQILGFMEMANAIDTSIKGELPLDLAIEAYDQWYHTHLGELNPHQPSLAQQAMTNPGHLRRFKNSVSESEFRERIANAKSAPGVEPAFIFYEFGYSLPERGTHKRHGTYWEIKHDTSHGPRAMNHIFRASGSGNVGDINVFREYSGLEVSRITYVQPKKTLPESMRKRYTTWRVYTDADPTAAFARALELASQDEGTQTTDRKRAAAAKRSTVRTIRDARKLEDQHPPGRLAHARLASSVSKTTADSLNKGAEIGIPDAVIQSQLADVGLIKEAYFGPKARKSTLPLEDMPMGPRGGFILANEAGTGKTFVLLGAIADILNQRKDTIVVYATTGNNLIRQIRADAKAADLRLADGTLVTERIRFVTYASLRSGTRRVDPFKEETIKKGLQEGTEEFNRSREEGRHLFVLDEPDSEQAGVPNLHKPTGKIVGNLISEVAQSGGMTIFSSATPFKNPIDAQYLAPSGIFGDETRFVDESNGEITVLPAFAKWAIMFGAETRFDSRTNTIIPVWPKPTDSLEKATKAQEDAKAASEWFAKRGMFTRRTKTLPKKLEFKNPETGEASLVDFVTMNFAKVDISGEQIEGDSAERTYAEYANQLIAAFDDFRSDVGGLNQNTWSWLTHRLKRIAEGGKANVAKKKIQEHLDSGRHVAVFTETKADTQIGKFKRPEDLQYGGSNNYWANELQAGQETLFEPGQVIHEYEGWIATGREEPMPFSVVSYDIARIVERNPGLVVELPSVADSIADAFIDDEGNPLTTEYTGRILDREAASNLKAWENREVPILIVTMGKGGTGLSLHDTLGNRPNGSAQIMVSMPWVAAKVDQVSGRLARYGMKSPVFIEWLFARSSDMAFEEELAKRVSKRMFDMGATVKGLSKKDMPSISQLESFHFQGNVDATDAILNGYRSEESASPSAIRTQDYARAETEEAQSKYRKPAKPNPENIASRRPVAMLFARLLGGHKANDQKILDPSAGKGDALIYMDYSNSITVVDPKAGHITSAATRLPASMNSYEGNFEDSEVLENIRHEQGLFDSIAMVPPIAPNSTGDSLLAYTHMENARELLNENGRMVAIVPWDILHDDTLPGYANFFEWLADENVVVAQLHKNIMGYHSAILVFDAGATEPGITIIQNNEKMLSFEAIEEALPERANPQGTAQEEAGVVETEPFDEVSTTIDAEEESGSLFSTMPEFIANTESRDKPYARNQPAIEDAPAYANALESSTSNRHQVVPAPLPEGVRVQRVSLRKIRFDLEKALGRSIVRTLKIPSNRRNVGGIYDPTTGLIAVKYNNDFLTMTHELGHFLHAQFGLLSELSPGMTHLPLGKIDSHRDQYDTAEQQEQLDMLQKFDEDMLFFLTANGSSAQPKSSPVYKRQEMIAAFFVEYILNPDSAREKSPWFYDYVEDTIRGHQEHDGEAFLSALKEFGLRSRAFYHGSPWFKLVGMFADATFYENMMLPWHQRVANIWKHFEAREVAKLGYGALAHRFVDDRYHLIKLINELGIEAGGKEWEKTFIGAKNPMNRLSGLGGFDDMFWQMVRHGPRSVITGRQTLDYGIQDVFATLIPEGQSSDETIFEKKLRLEAFMLNQSALEDARNNHKFGKMLIQALEDVETLTEHLEDLKADIKDLRGGKKRSELSEGEQETLTILLEDVAATTEEKEFQQTQVKKYQRKLGIPKDQLEPSKILKHVAAKNSTITPAGIGLESAEDAHTRLEEWLQNQDNWEAGEFETYERAATMWRDWADAMVLQPLLNSGRMSQQTYAEIKRDRKQYVTMKRTLEDVHGLRMDGPQVKSYERGVGRAISATSKSLGKAMGYDPKRKGSMSSLKMPTEQLLLMAYNARFEAQRNLIGKGIIGLLKATEQTDYDMSSGAPVPKGSTIMYKVEDPSPTHTLTVYENGKEAHYHVVDPKAAAVFAGLNDEITIAALQAINVVRSAMQYLIVNSLPFAIRNRIRDAWDRAFKSQGGSKPWDSFVTARAIGKGVTRWDRNAIAKTYEEYNTIADELTALGGSQIGLWYAIRGGKQKYDKFLQREITDLSRGQSWKSLNPYENTAVVMGNDMIKSYSEWKRSGEMKNRVAEYKRVKDKFIAQGATEMDASLEAMRASRDLIDFAVAGSLSRQIGKVVMFFNPAIQGARASVGLARRDPKLFMLRVLTYSILPSMMVYAWNAMMGYDDEYAELPDWQRAHLWNLGLPGGWWIRIPKPFELGVPGSFFEMGALHVAGYRDPYSAKYDALGALVGPITALQTGFFGVFAGITTRFSNKTTFYQSQIIPPYEQSQEVIHRNKEKMARQPELHKTRVARLTAEILSGGGLISGREGAADLADPRMKRAVIEGQTGITGKIITKSYQLAVEPNMSNLWDLTQYMAGNTVGPDRKLRARSIDKFYELSKKLKSPPSAMYNQVKTLKELWDTSDDSEEKRLIYNELIDYLHETIPVMEEMVERDRQIAAQEWEIFNERNR